MERAGVPKAACKQLAPVPYSSSLVRGPSFPTVHTGGVAGGRAGRRGLRGGEVWGEGRGAREGGGVLGFARAAGLTEGRGLVGGLGAAWGEGDVLGGVGLGGEGGGCPGLWPYPRPCGPKVLGSP